MLRLSLILMLALAHLLTPPSAWANQADCVPKADSLVPLEAEATQLIEALRNPCASYTLTEAKQQYEKSFPPSQARLQGRVGGFLLRGTKEEIEIGRKVLIGRVPSSWLEAARDCKEVKCALGKLYGSEEAALRVLSLAKDTGYLISASQELSPQDLERFWSPSEIIFVDRGVRRLPPKFWHLKSMGRFLRPSDARRDPGLLAFARRHDGLYPGYVSMFDSSFKSALQRPGTPYHPERTLIHELAHHFDYSKGEKGKAFNESSGFSRLSGWKPAEELLARMTGKYVSTDGSQFATRYAETNPFEDFAETIADYLEDPVTLRSRAPKKYEFVREKVFDGVEYQGREEWQTAIDSIAANHDRLMNSLISCTRRISSIRLGAPAPICEIPENGTSTVQGDCDLPRRLESSDCFKEYSDKLDEEFQKDPQYCKKSGYGLAEYYSKGGLRTRMSIIETVISGLNAFVVLKENQEVLAKACGPKGQQDPACVIKTYLAQYSWGILLFKAMDPKLQQAVVDHLALVLKL